MDKAHSFIIYDDICIWAITISRQIIQDHVNCHGPNVTLYELINLDRTTFSPLILSKLDQSNPSSLGADNTTIC